MKPTTQLIYSKLKITVIDPENTRTILDVNQNKQFLLQTGDSYGAHSVPKPFK